MPNPIKVTVPVTKENVKSIFIEAETYAANKQKAMIKPEKGQPIVFQGHGEGKQIGSQRFDVKGPGLYNFNVEIENDSGKGWKPSTMVRSGSLSGYTLNETFVLSEDATDRDQNDCIVTFRWFENND